MTVRPTPTEQLDLLAPDIDHVSVQIGLFDEAEHEDDRRLVPLARYVQELSTLPHRPR